MFTLESLILAGGKATRMSGVDKGLQEYLGRPLIEYAVDLAELYSEKVLISVNRNQEAYRDYSDYLISDLDEYSDKGPLGGLASAKNSLSSSHLLVLPCDTPKVSQQAIRALVKCAQKSPNLIHFISTESGHHPLHGVVPVSCLSLLDDYLKSAERLGVMAFYNHVGCQSYHWANDSELDNINLLEQLR
ncbi:molybdenum cofactor guanylyltransferase [Rhodanobacter aciditrophus]|uniref:Molybdenum cofactor guanylyltransferase n=1 Tax=Rhodanobacter aciditrophus TaxID=1623218 RepID=A0ABW4B6I1_9GAMM